MKSEVEGALSLAVKHLKRVTWNTRGHSRKHVEKAQKQLSRAKRYGGPDLRLCKERWKWTFSSAKSS